MILIGHHSFDTFKMDGIVHQRNFVTVINGNSISIHYVYDCEYVLLPLTPITEIRVLGQGETVPAVFTNILELKEVLDVILFQGEFLGDAHEGCNGVVVLPIKDVAVQSFTGAAGQTDFVMTVYPDEVVVVVNEVKYRNDTKYNFTAGSNIVQFNAGIIEAGDFVEIYPIFNPS